jgi:hypothetical protein
MEKNNRFGSMSLNVKENNLNRKLIGIGTIFKITRFGSTWKVVSNSKVQVIVYQKYLKSQDLNFIIYIK